MPLTVASVLVQGIVKLTTTSHLAGILGLLQWWNEDNTRNKWDENNAINANGRIFKWFDGKWTQYVGSGIEWNLLCCFYEVKIFWCSTFPRVACWSRYGYNVGCNLVYQFPTSQFADAKYYGNPTWYLCQNWTKNMHLWNLTQLDPWLVSNLLSQIGFPKLGASFTTQVQFPRALLHQKLQGSLRNVPCSAKTSWWQLKYFLEIITPVWGKFPIFDSSFFKWVEKMAWKVKSIFLGIFLPISWWRCVQKLPGGACPGEPDGKGDWTMSALHGYTSTSCYLDLCLFLVFPAAQVRQNFRF